MIKKRNTQTKKKQLAKNLKCIACHKIYSNRGNLNKHLRKNKLCQEWIELMKDNHKTFSHNLYERYKILELNTIQGSYKWMKDILTTSNNEDCADKWFNFQIGRYECISCGKTFTTNSNVLRHYKKSIICQKWYKLNNDEIYKMRFYKHLNDSKQFINKGLLKLADMPIGYTSEGYIKDNHIFVSTKKADIKKVECSDLCKLDFTNFFPPNDNLIHIIWNIYLSDKYQKINKALIENNKIGYIIAILPTEEHYKNYIDPALVPYYTIEYNDQHKDVIDSKLLQIYQEQCDKIELVRKTEYRNIIIFCNNGYQRSIPFICYYLLKYHPDEYSSLLRVLELILSRIDNKYKKKELDEYIKLLPRLCELFQ